MLDPAKDVAIGHRFDLGLRKTELRRDCVVVLTQVRGRLLELGGSTVQPDRGAEHLEGPARGWSISTTILLANSWVPTGP